MSINQELNELKYLKKSNEEKSEYILTTNNPELNYMAITNLNISNTQKRKHIEKIKESKNAYWNYKCIKFVLNIRNLSKEEKHNLITPHVEIVLNSEDTEIIKQLSKLLQFKPNYKNYTNNKKKIKTKNRI